MYVHNFIYLITYTCTTAVAYYERAAAAAESAVMHK